MDWKTGKLSHMLYRAEVHRNADKGITTLFGWFQFKFLDIKIFA
jgi:hypothetical protein